MLDMVESASEELEHVVVELEQQVLPAVSAESHKPHLPERL